MAQAEYKVYDFAGRALPSPDSPSRLQHWTTLESTPVFEHRWYRLLRERVSLPSGAELDDYFVSDREDVAIVFAVTKDGQALLVRQYKQGARELMTEVPAGFFHQDEDPLEAAQRELLEETGFSAGKWTLLQVTRDNPTKDNNRFYLFLAEDCEPVAHAEWDATEEIELLACPVGDLPKWIANGVICTHSSIAAIFLGMMRLKG